jgi:glycosyltransferase involved in cell wall biosynthesis
MTIVIPAHNEGRVIRRLLEQLINGADPGEMDIIVVANGCTDDTAEVAASFGPAVRVLTLPAACKQKALIAGDRAAAGFPRIYLDADLELRADDVRALAAALSQPGVLAAAPPPALRPPPPTRPPPHPCPVNWRAGTCGHPACRDSRHGRHRRASPTRRSFD